MKELRAALADQLKQPDGPTSELANVLKRVGKEAHQKNVPPEELIVIFMTQFIPSSTYPVRRDLRTLVYSAFEE